MKSINSNNNNNNTHQHKQQQQQQTAWSLLFKFYIQFVSIGSAMLLCFGSSVRKRDVCCRYCLRKMTVFATLKTTASSFLRVNTVITLSVCTITFHQNDGPKISSTTFPNKGTDYSQKSS